MYEPSARQPLATAITLTGSAVSSTYDANINCRDQQSLYVKYTPGASTNVLTVTVETTPQNAVTPDASADWYQDQYWTDSAGTETRTLKQFSFTATGTDPVYIRKDFSMQGDRLRIKYSETGATKGTISAEIYSRSSSAS